MENNDDIFYQVWFPRETQEITIIGATNFDDLERSKKDYANTALIDGMGDRDAIFHVGLLLSRKYPNASIKLELSHETQKHNYDWKKNLVIIGGPGGDGVLDPDTGEIRLDPNNHACRKYNDIPPPSKISYSNDAETMFCLNNPYVTINTKIEDENKKILNAISLDYGYFSAFQNDLSNKHRVILIHGTHTLGVLGATKIFDDSEDDLSINNYNVLFNKFGNFKKRTNKNALSFESFFEVKVQGGLFPYDPEIEESKIFFYDDIESDGIYTHSVFISHSSENRDEALRIEKELENKNITTVIAPRDMEVGKWKPQIKAKIEQEKLKILVLILTKEAQESEIVEYEISTAIRAKKMVIAYQPENFEIDDLFDKLINDTHKVIAYDNTHQNPTEELIRLVSNYLRNHTR